MKNVIHIIIIIVSCLVAGILGGKLNTTQRELAPSKEAISGMPLGGFQKFISDMEWMLFVNYLGSLNTVDESNVDEVSRRLERLMSHDPNLGKIYQEGALMISIADPEKTVEILTKACNNPHLKSNSQIPFYAGFVMVQHMKPPKYKEAIPFFKMAVDRSGGGEGFNNYYASYYYRAKAKVWSDGKFDDRHALLHVLYDSWLGDTRDENYVGGGTMGGDSVDLKDRLFNAIRNVKNESEDYKPTVDGNKLADAVVQRVFSDSHICHACTAAYGPGVEYCSGCGTKLKVYGVCQFCQKAVLPGAKFCTTTGQKFPEESKK